MNPDLRLRLHATQAQPCFPAASNALALPDGNGIFTATPTERITHYTLLRKVVCVLIGERPGLLTDESMSAYIAYKPHPDMSESDYTVVSNISRFGMPPVEAAAYIADVIKEMLRQKASGLRLKL